MRSSARSSAFTDEDLAELRIDGGMKMVAIRTPGVGKISDREKKEIRSLADELGKRFKNFVGTLYDFSQIEKKKPQVAAKIRELCGAAPDDLIVPVVAIASADSKPRTRAQEHAQYAAAGEARLELGRKYSHKQHAS